ncbi:MAG: hypothetical protein ACI9CD_000114 [Candidatus Deianiraeaceae bacterium]|jgi:hypothetical protein
MSNTEFEEFEEYRSKLESKFIHPQDYRKSQFNKSFSLYYGNIHIESSYGTYCFQYGVSLEEGASIR